MKESTHGGVFCIRVTAATKKTDNKISQEAKEEKFPKRHKIHQAWPLARSEGGSSNGAKPKGDLP